MDDFSDRSCFRTLVLQTADCRLQHLTREIGNVKCETLEPRSVQCTYTTCNLYNYNTLLTAGSTRSSQVQQGCDHSPPTQLLIDFLDCICWNPVEQPQWQLSFSVGLSCQAVRLGIYLSSISNPITRRDEAEVNFLWTGRVTTAIEAEEEVYKQIYLWSLKSDIKI